jgi:hypothetical protein
VAELGKAPGAVQRGGVVVALGDFLEAREQDDEGLADLEEGGERNRGPRGGAVGEPGRRGEPETDQEQVERAAEGG